MAGQDKVLVVCDYAQIEVKVGALLSGEHELIKRMASGLDMHVLMAADLYGVDVEDVTKEQRNRSKGLTFGVQYGMKEPSLSKVLGCSLSEAHRWLGAWQQQYPSMHNQRKLWRREAGRTKCLMTAGGRRLLTGSKVSYQQAANYPVQGGAADCMYAAMGAFFPLRKERGLEDVRLRLVVHDEIVVEAPRELAQSAQSLVEDAMVAGFSLVFPHAPTYGLVDSSVCSNWSEKG